MSSFITRKKTQINLKTRLKKKVEESPPWVKTLLDFVEIPPMDTIFRRLFLFAFMGGWSIMNSSEGGPAFQVAVSLAACIYFLNEKTKSLGRACVIGIGALAAGWFYGSLIIPMIPTFLIHPTWTLKLLTSLVVYGFLFLSCTFLKLNSRLKECTKGILEDPVLDIEENVTTIDEQFKWREPDINKRISRKFSGQETETNSNDKVAVVTSENGVVAADHETCSKIGAEVLELLGGTALDAAVAVAFCLGVLNPSSSGVGGGAFMVVGSSGDSVAKAYDMRETAPLAASQDMFENREAERVVGALSIAVPGDIAGLYKAWERHGRVPWKLLVEPSIKLARECFEVGSHLAFALSKNEAMIKNDIGLKSVFTNGDELLKKGDKCYNLKLAETLEAVAEKGMKAFYEEDVAEMLVNDVKEAGGILTMEDLWSYEVNVSDAMVINDVMGYKIQGMWLPSCGTTGFAMVMNVMERYVNENLGLHHVIEAMKHLLAARMDLGDPAFVNGTYNVVERMISKSYAKRIHRKISDSRTFPPEHYLNKYNQLEEQGTSHFCVVDKDRNVVSMTTSVNYAFGSGFMSPSTGIILNGHMEDFSIPSLDSSNSLPPAPANYIVPKKRALSSMMPLIITKDTELVGVIGASGVPYIMPSVIQVFLNHFVFKMSPLEAVRSPRVYPKLKLNEVLYEDMKVYNGDQIKLKEETQEFLKSRGHELVATNVGGIVQLVVQNRLVDSKTVLTAVSDLRKDGKPAAANATKGFIPSCLW